jgi:serine/threonine-protein kinase HipA
MAPTELVVAIEGVVAGVVDGGAGRLRFTYDDAYRRRPAATPLSLSMPLQVRSHPDRAIRPWLWGLLPDNAEVLARWARRFHVSASSPAALLATPVGEDCAGAVQLAPPERIEAVLRRPGGVAWLTDEDVADRLRALRADATAWLGPDFTGQFSLGGAQAKTALLHDGDRWGAPSGAAPTTHILKPAIAGLDDHDLDEHLCLEAARRAGLVAARSRIARFGDQTAVVVERYDRARVGGELVRVHQEDLCQALGVAPAAKYQADGGPSPGRIAQLLRGALPPAPAESAVWALCDALVWNWVIAGTDAHAKNYSVLLAGGQVRFAPLYDVASALGHPGVDELKLQLAMKVGGEYRLKAHRASSWVRSATELGLDPDAVLARVVELVARAPEALAEVAATAEVRALASPLPGRLVDAVGARSRRLAAQLAIVPPARRGDR